MSSSILIESVQRLKSQFPNVNSIEIPSDYNIGFEIAGAKHIACTGKKCGGWDSNPRTPEGRDNPFLRS